VASDDVREHSADSPGELMALADSLRYQNPLPAGAGDRSSGSIRTGEAKQ
jgi:hypothetical protein